MANKREAPSEQASNKTDVSADVVHNPPLCDIAVMGTPVIIQLLYS